MLDMLDLLALLAGASCTLSFCFFFLFCVEHANSQGETTSKERNQFHSVDGMSDMSVRSRLFNTGLRLMLLDAVAGAGNPASVAGQISSRPGSPIPATNKKAA